MLFAANRVKPQYPLLFAFASVTTSQVSSTVTLNRSAESYDLKRYATSTQVYHQSMGLEQDEIHAGHEACRGSNSQLVVGSGQEVPPLVSNTRLCSGLAQGSGNEPTVLRDSSSWSTRHQVTQLRPTSTAGRGIRTGEVSCKARSESRQGVASW